MMTNTNKMRDESREQFEAFCREVQGWEDDDFRLASDGVNYYWSTTGDAWMFWQASRQAVVVDLPDAYCWDNDGGFQRDYDPDSECSMALIPSIDVRIAIEAQGLRVGVKP